MRYQLGYQRTLFNKYSGQCGTRVELREAGDEESNTPLAEYFLNIIAGMVLMVAC